MDTNSSASNITTFLTCTIITILTISLLQAITPFTTLKTNFSHRFFDTCDGIKKHAHSLTRIELEAINNTSPQLLDPQVAISKHI
jgi:hypothetical protein